MNCHACAADNPPDARFCSNCGVRIVDHTTGSNAAIADLVAVVVDGPAAPKPPTIPEPYEQTPPPQAPLQRQHPTTTARTTDEPVAGPPLLATARPSVVPIVATVAAVLLLVGAGAFILLSTGDDEPDSIVTPTDVDTVPSTVPATTASGAVETTVTTPIETIPDTAAPTAPTAPTAPPGTLGADPAAVPPPPPEPGPVDAPGSPQVLANIQPSGPTSADVEPSFELAQEFGDALALENWERARQLSPELAATSDADFVRGYGSTNRVSLMLRDAQPEGSGYRLLVVSVAVENGGAQTSLFCLEWAVDPVAGTVDQRGGSKLATWDGNAQPEAIRNDPAAMQIVNSCTYP